MESEMLIRPKTVIATTNNPEPLVLGKRFRLGETIIQGFLFLCGFISIFTTLGIVYELGKESLLFFGSEAVSLVEFFTSTTWQPAISHFGVWPLVTATLTTSAIAMTVALPLGLGAAIYLSEYATTRARNSLKPILEVLAGIPTVVYGYFALTFMTPILQTIFGDRVGIYNMASAGIVMGILIIPLVASLSEDALSAVPRSLREAAYGLGATKLETSVKIVVPAALSGITAAFVIAISRAVGETMIVALASGAGPAFTFNPFKAAETMTGHIVRISGGDLSYNTIDYNSIFAIGLLLFVMTLVLNIISQRIVARFREVYE
jgi:phosphate transport system permease protein